MSLKKTPSENHRLCIIAFTITSIPEIGRNVSTLFYLLPLSQELLQTVLAAYALTWPPADAVSCHSLRAISIV